MRSECTGDLGMGSGGGGETAAADGPNVLHSAYPAIVVYHHRFLGLLAFSATFPVFALFFCSFTAFVQHRYFYFFLLFFLITSFPS